MAIELIARIWNRPRDEVDPSEKFVLTVMADRADQDGLLWYAVDTIADLTSFTPRAVQKILERLIRKGLVKKHHRRDRSNYYIIQVDRFPFAERKKRVKERGPAEYVEALEAIEPDLFGTGEPGSGTGERRSPTGEPGSGTGEPGSPYSLSDSLSDSLRDNPPTPLGDEGLIEIVMQSWNAIAEQHEKVPAIAMMNEQRTTAVLRRAAEFKGRFADDPDPRLAVWRFALTVVSQSRLLTGQKLEWVCSFDWVAKKANFLKVMERNYGRGDDQIGAQGRTGDRSAVAAGSAALSALERHRRRGRTNADHSR